MDAPTYNKSRPYTSRLWKEIQRTVGTTPDGIPGPRTADAISTYQAGIGLGADGKCGRVTTTALNLRDGSSDWWIGHAHINADGAPNAYHPEDIGIDYLANAGRPGNWWALATDDQGRPYVQCRHDGREGFYVSTTSLVDTSHHSRSPARYVDSTRIPYIVLTMSWRNLSETRPQKGDLAMVCRLNDPRTRTFAIYADVGPSKDVDDVMGEVSILTAQRLGHDPYRTRNGVRRADIGSNDEFVYIVFPGSGRGDVMTIDEIDRQGAGAYARWGGDARLAELFSTI